MIEPYAYSELNLHPWELMRYTPGEVRRKIDGHQKRQKAELRLKAYFVAMLMNSSGNIKQPMTAEKLLNLEEPETRKKKKNSISDIEALARRCGGK